MFKRRSMYFNEDIEVSQSPDTNELQLDATEGDAIATTGDMDAVVSTGELITPTVTDGEEEVAAMTEEDETVAAMDDIEDAVESDEKEELTTGEYDDIVESADLEEVEDEEDDSDDELDGVLEAYMLF